MIEVIGKLEPNDYVRAQYLHIRPRPVFKAVGFVLLLLLGWAIWYSFWGGGSDSFSAFDLIMPSSVIYLSTNYYLYIPWKAKRIYRQQRSLQLETTYQFTDEGLFASNNMGQASMPWSDYLKWKENDKLFLLYSSDPMFHMVPKRHFSGSGDIRTFRQMLHENIGRSAV